jgi:intein/homing endonuclease
MGTDNKIDYLNELSKFIFSARYSRYDKTKQRRNTWEEAIDTVKEMHLKKYGHLLLTEHSQRVIDAFSRSRDRKLFAPSMRSIQFAGAPIEAHNAKAFNCTASYCHSLRWFSEVFYLLLCGSGVTIGLHPKYMDMLPDLVAPKHKTGSVITYVVEDSIEGWADAANALLNCYFKNNPYSGRKIVFDFSRIRAAGSPLKTTGGKAPGHEGLKQSLLRIKEHLDYVIEILGQKRLKTIDAYDIVMHLSDAVLSGGIRRAATAAIFELDDTDMMKSKTSVKVSRPRLFKNEETGEYEGHVTINKRKYDVESVRGYEYSEMVEKKTLPWYCVFPWRKRANNSVRLVSGRFAFEQFKEIFESTRYTGDPGFVFSSSEDVLFNPCQPGFAPILTPQGIRTLDDIKIGDRIWSETGWTVVANKWSTGVKRVHAYKTRAGIFYGTENHRIISDGTKIEVDEAQSIDLLRGVSDDINKTIDPSIVIDGLMIGDGSVEGSDKKSNTFLIVGAKDGDYFTDPVSQFIIGRRRDRELQFDVASSIEFDELPPLPVRTIPDRFVFGDLQTKVSFLRGLFSANGSVVSTRITLKSTSIKLVEQVQLMLNSIGIASYYTTNRPSDVTWHNGIYTSKQSYDLNINSDREKFRDMIGFIQQYKSVKLTGIIQNKKGDNKGKRSFEIIEKDYLGEMEVFDLTVDNDTHTYWTGGLNVSNCFEAGMYPIADDGRLGFSFCNLTSVNGAEVKDLDDFLVAVEDAAIVGTLQAGYTNYEYLDNASREIAQRDALLGVSITGFMDNPDLLLNERNLYVAAKLAVKTNREWAKVIGINPAKRITLTKPEGTWSLVAKAASGVHPHHAERYWRRVQENRNSNVLQFFELHNPSLVEESKHSSTKTDRVIKFPVEVKSGTIVKDHLTAIEHLNMIRRVYENWVLPGEENNDQPVTHNVSCTVEVMDSEWDEVAEYLFENQKSFGAVSLLGKTSDKQWEQAPLERILTEEDENEWERVLSVFNSVDYTQLTEISDETKVVESVACAGGACEIT